MGNTVKIYKLNPFEMHLDCQQNGFIGCIGATIYLYNHTDKVVCCYDSDGKLLESNLNF